MSYKIYYSTRILILGCFLLFCIKDLAVAQKPTQPSIMILPADGLLQRSGHLKRIEIDGRMRTVQDYEQLFIDEPELRFAISQIQERFAERGFPLTDLEFALKRINTEEAFDATENIDIDLKGILLKQAKPDIYLDLDYFYSGSGLQRTLAFNIRAIDAYSDLAVATASHEGIASVRNNVAATLAEQVELNINNLQELMQQHFDDLKANGRIISLRVSLETNSLIRDFRRERCQNLPYTHFIRDYVKRNSVEGTHHLDAASAKDIRYDQIRIPLYDAEGYPMGAADWAFALAEFINEQCDQYVIDITAKLGEAHILFLSE